MFTTVKIIKDLICNESKQKANKQIIRKTMYDDSFIIVPFMLLPRNQFITHCTLL